MAQPFNYMLSVPNPAEAVTSGLQQGVQLAGMMERADALAAQRRQTQLETQLMQAKALREQAQRDALDAFYKKPATERTAADYEAISATLPKEMADNVRASFDAKTKEEQRQDLLFGSQVLSALRLKDTGTASQMLQERAKAFESSGMKAQAQAMQNLADMTLIDPERAELALGPTMAVVPGGKDFIENIAKQQATQFEAQLQPSKMRKAAGEAEEAEAKGRLTGKKIESEIAQAKASAQSSLANAARAAEEAKTERESRRAKVDGLVAEAALKTANAREAIIKANTAEERRAAETDLLKARAEEQRAKSKMSNFKPATKAFESATSALDTTSGMLASIDKLEKLINAPGITGGTVLDRITGPLSSRAFNVTSEARDVDAILQQLTAQSFLEKIPTMRGTGPVSNAEGERLAAAAGNLTLNQSPKQFRETLSAMKAHAQKIQSEAQQTVTKYNQDYGEAPQAGASAMSDDALMKALGL